MNDMQACSPALPCNNTFLMQDAFTKTVPIWCAVLNRAVQEVRQHLRTAEYAHNGHEPEGSQSEAASWDCDLHVPPWVSENEANHISARLDSWTTELLQARTPFT